VDYAGIVKALRKALADYTNNVSGGKTDPTIDKSELLNCIIEIIAKTEAFLSGVGATLSKIIESKNFEKIAAIQDTANAVCSSAESKKTFSTYATELSRLVKYTNREDITTENRDKINAIDAVARNLKAKRRHVTNVDLMVQLNQIVNEYIEMDTSDVNKSSKQFDISSVSVFGHKQNKQQRSFDIKAHSQYLFVHSRGLRRRARQRAQSRHRFH
jgi:type I restriction enzyme R subunit